MGGFLFWCSAILLPLNLYFVAHGWVGAPASAMAAAVNVLTMIMLRRAA